MRKILFIITLSFIAILILFHCKKLPTGNPADNPTTGTVTDIDGNIYKTVKIGDQWWMAENLKVTRYRNGDDIQKITDNTAWKNLSTGAYCAYNNIKNYEDIYGYLYNWFAVDDSRNIAPTGWHVPTDAEWTTLTIYLGDTSVAGGKMKETDTTHWSSPNTGATNESGFSGLSGGYRHGNGNFFNLGSSALYWASTEYDRHDAWYWYLYYSNSDISRSSYSKLYGVSVRLVRD